MAGNQTGAVYAKLKKLQEEEKILIKLREQVDSQLISLRTEEVVIRYHLSTSNDSSASEFNTATAITNGHDNGSFDNTVTDKNTTESTLNLEVEEVLKAYSQYDDRDNRNNIVEEEDDDGEDL